METSYDYGLWIFTANAADLIIWPILTITHYRLAMREEREVMEQYPVEYAQYRQKVPALIAPQKT